MNAAVILQLLAQFGPPALQMIDDLIHLWSKPTLTPEEVLAFTAKARTSYDQYIAFARASLQPPSTG